MKTLFTDQETKALRGIALFLVRSLAPTTERRCFSMNALQRPQGTEEPTRLSSHETYQALQLRNTQFFP